MIKWWRTQFPSPFSCMGASPDIVDNVHGEEIRLESSSSADQVRHCQGKETVNKSPLKQSSELVEGERVEFEKRSIEAPAAMSTTLVQ